MATEASSKAGSERVGCLGALLLVGFGLLAGLAVAEIGLHLLLPIEPVFVKWDPVLGIRHRPGMKAWWYRETKGRRVWVEINSLGFRSPEVKRQKPAGTFRVLALGDSYLEGMQVPMGEVVTERLRALLQDSLRRPVEVINAGNMGYGQAEQSLLLAREGWGLSPDLVISFLYLGNDLADNWYQTGSHVRPSYELRGDSLVLHPPTLPAWKIFLRDHVLAHLAIPKFVRMYMLPRFPWAKRWAAREGLIIRDLGRAESDEDLHHMVDVAAALYQRMADDARRHDVPFMAFQFPAGFQLVSAYPDTTYVPPKIRHDAPGSLWSFDHFDVAMSRVFAEHGIPSLDALPGFRAAAARGDTLYIDFDGHFTSRGHEVAARLIADYLLAHRDSLLAGAGRAARPRAEGAAR